jgi:hypothetical protein
MKLSADAVLTMAVYTAEPGSPSHDSLNLLGRLVGDAGPGRGGQRGGRTLTRSSGRARLQILVTAPDSPVTALWSCRTRVRRDRRFSI